MYPKQLIAYISERLQAGMPGDEIRNKLIGAGWTKESVEEAFSYLKPKKKHRFFLPHVVTLAVTVVLLSIPITYAVFLFSGNKTLSYTVKLPTTVPYEQIEFSYGVQETMSNPDFFGKVKDQFIEDKADFIEANLSTMKLVVYKKGVSEIEVPINSKGREGSWWETPSGLYKIGTKEKAHFSSMGHVWMPWSMSFQGNFFIHGRTYYPDNTPTSAEFTGGCIRLSTEDARKVYNAINIGTPMLVFEDSFSPDNFTYDSNLEVEAPIFMAADLGNNHIFSSRGTTEKIHITSLTKLMTALIATEYIDIDQITTLPDGTRSSIYRLLFPLLLESSDEAAEAIAKHYSPGRKKFINNMNEKALSLGMINTSFSDPSGISEENVSTAEDMFMLTKYIYNNRSFLFNITSEKFRGDAYEKINFKEWNNLNFFVEDKNFFGGRTALDENSPQANISVFKLDVGDIKRPIVIMVLNSSDAKKDSEAILTYVLKELR